jgi:flagellar rod assembly protein/muramidase FlgJ
MGFDVARSPLSIDPRGIDGLKRDVRAGDDSPETLRAVAKQFESLFARMLIKSMRETSFGDGLMDSEQSEFYRDMFDQQLAVELSEGKGLGLADMLVRQLAQGSASNGPSPGPAADLSHASVGEVTPSPGQTAALVPASVGEVKTGTDWRPASREEFVRQLWPHAQAAGRALGVSPATIVSHAALETGWGRSLPQQANGQTSYNLFGIKTGGRWEGASAPSSTLEFRGGAMVRSREQFRAYDSLGDGVADYARLLGGSPRYAAARNTGADVDAFAGALQRAGYATDPQYADKLRAVAAQVNTMLAPTDGLKVAAAGPITPTRSAT